MNKQCINGFKGLFLLFLLFTTSYTFAQKVDEQVFDSVEVMPQFPGGVSKMMQYLRIPVSETVIMGSGVQGRPIIQFIVEKDGKVVNAKVVRSVDPQLDKEALKLIEDMPSWIPGEQKGKKVRVRMTVPVFTILESSLKLEEQERKKEHEKEVKPQNGALIIIDGVEVGSNFLEYLTTENIKDFKVLKGKEALDLYGEKGQNGVILISLPSLKELKGKTIGEKVTEMLKDGGYSKKTPVVYCIGEKQLSPEESKVISKNIYNENSFIVIKEVKEGTAYVTIRKNSSFYIR